MLEMSKPVINEVKALNTFAQDTKIIGNIESDGDIRLDGTLEGYLNCKGRVVIGPDAKIKGKIYARNVEVLGYVEGEITAIELLSPQHLSHRGTPAKNLRTSYLSTIARPECHL